MEEGRESGTAIGAAVVRALHQTLDEEPHILDDPIAPRLVASELAQQQMLFRFVPFGARLRAHFVMRSRYAEDCLAEAHADGIRQYVILGAGLDTFAYRQPEWARDLRIFEADYPATQKWKRERLGFAGIRIPGNVVYVPVDFENTTLEAGFSGAPLDRGGLAFFSLLGVTQYLSEAALDASLKFVLSMPRRSEIVFSFVPTGNSLSMSERAAGATFTAIAALRRERWRSRWDPKTLSRRLSAMGFSRVIHFSAEEANARYFRGRRDGLAVSRLEEMMRATV